MTDENSRQDKECDEIESIEHENKKKIIVMMEPVLNEKSEPCWLTMRTEKVSISNTNQPMKDLIQDTASFSIIEERKR